MDEKLEKLYSQLFNDGLYTKSFDNFKSQFSNVDKQNKLYAKLNADGLYTKSLDDFKNQFFQAPKPVKKKEDTELPLSSDQQKSSSDGKIITPKTQEELAELIAKPGQQRPEVPVLDVDQEKAAQYRTTLLENMEAARQLSPQEISDIETQAQEDASAALQLEPARQAVVTGAPGVRVAQAAPEPSEYQKQRPELLKEYSRAENLPVSEIDEDELRGYFLEKRTRELLETKQDQRLEDYIENLPDEDRVSLKAFREGALKEVSNKNLHRSVVLEESVARAQQIRTDIEQGAVSPTPEIVGELNKNIESAYNTLNQIGESTGDIMTLEKEIDLLKRNYNPFDNFFGETAAAGTELVVNLDKALNDFNDLVGLEKLPAPIQLIGEKIAGEPFLKENLMNQAAEFVEQSRAELRKSKTVSDINSLKDFGSWATDLIAEQAPNVAMLATTGGAGLGVLGTTAYGGEAPGVRAGRKAWFGTIHPNTKACGGSYGGRRRDFIGACFAGIARKNKAIC